MAKQMCQEDANCSAILKVIPTLCGPELGQLHFYINTNYSGILDSYTNTHNLHHLCTLIL